MHYVWIGNLGRVLNNTWTRVLIVSAVFNEQ